MNRDRVVRPAPGVIFKAVGEEMVLLDLDGGMYYGLDPVGADLWKRLAAGRTAGEVVDAMLEEYDVTREQLEGDLERLLAELTERKLLL